MKKRNLLIIIVGLIIASLVITLVILNNKNKDKDKTHIHIRLIIFFMLILLWITVFTRQIALLNQNISRISCFNLI